MYHERYVKFSCSLCYRENTLVVCQISVRQRMQFDCLESVIFNCIVYLRYSIRVIWVHPCSSHQSVRISVNSIDTFFHRESAYNAFFHIVFVHLFYKFFRRYAYVRPASEISDMAVCIYLPETFHFFF